MRAEGLNVQFLVAGEPDTGNPASVPEEQQTAWREQGNMTLLGHVQDMPPLMATADVVVLPTSYREGVPRSLIEAAAAGLPIVTTPLGIVFVPALAGRYPEDSTQCEVIDVDGSIEAADHHLHLGIGGPGRRHHIQ